MLENLLNMLRQRQPRSRVYEGRHRAEPPRQRQADTSSAPVAVN
ncbi:MAG: hypothetical protein ACRDT6_26560 [Micromonosporaceae bacterium]